MNEMDQRLNGEDAPATALEILMEKTEESEVGAVAKREPWLFWPTMGFSAAIGAIALFAQILFAVIWIVGLVLITGDIHVDGLVEDGNYLIGSTLFSYPFVFGAMILFIKLKDRYPLKDYLEWHSWRSVKLKEIVLWLLAILLLMLLFQAFINVIGYEEENVMLFLIESVNTPLLLFTLVFGAPVLEELFFRGFMFKGLLHSKAGPVGAILITTLLWAAIHGFQYSWVEILYLILLGILLGFARLKTGSVALPIALHVINNLIAILPALLVLKMN